MLRPAAQVWVPPSPRPGFFGFGTSTTKRLEGYARARGLHYRVGTCGGSYHLVASDGSSLRLGHSRRRAEQTIRHLSTPTTES